MLPTSTAAPAAPPAARTPDQPPDRPPEQIPGRTHLPQNCRLISEILARIGDKWSVLIVILLGDGPRRFNEIRRRVGGISQRMLSLTLRRLERDGVVARTVFPTVPPTVEYALTDLGRSLWRPIEGLGAWALEHQPVIEAARQRFDAAHDREAEDI